MKNLLKCSLFFSLLFIVTSCSKNEPEAPEVIVNKYLVSTELVKSYTLVEYKGFLQKNLGTVGGFDISLFSQNGIKQYKITYKTKDALGKEVTASGAFIAPDVASNEYALGSLQHGSLTNKLDAPSYFGTNTEATLGGILASTGMYIVQPDYIGYGTSDGSKHPYEHNVGLSEPNIDLIRAVKEYFVANNLKWNNKILLAGYSEGGYASMAMLKSIETNYSSEFNVTVASLGAGAYNKTGSIMKMLTEKSAGNPTHNSSYIWVLRTYNELEGLNRPMSSYFIEPYATQITKDGENVAISGDFKTLLQPTFIKGILDGTDTAFLKALKNNDIYDWSPKTVLNLYHGTADTYVPFLNTQTAYDAMKKKGALKVSIVPINGKDHGDAISDYFLGTFQLFSSYR